jgi:5-methyltetrahydrofolate--homocysteine methyltransferase
MENVINFLQTKGLRENVKVMVGGAPLSAEFAQKIGADAFGKDAAEAASLAKSFINK